ncbi:MAG: FecCD family ABC transporter permease [Oxalobacteraceae bacterium]
MGNTLRQSLRELLLLAIAAAAIVLLAGLCGGNGCFTPASSTDVLWQLRVPRALSAFAVGGSLALSGALMQLLLRNPLADPYVLGVSGGAAAGALAAGWLLPASLALYGLHIGALAGALMAIGLLFGLAHPAVTGASSLSLNVYTGVRLILTGVMISAGCGALISLLLSLSDDTGLRGAMFWLMGDLDTTELIWPVWLVLLLSLAWSCRHASVLNVLSHGDLTAHLLGLPVKRLRITALLVASTTAAAAVSVAGAIGFVGLVVPHALRLLMGNDQRRLLPASVLAGGAALCLADLAARSVIAPVQLPVGVITAMVGVPLFLVLLSRSR